MIGSILRRLSIGFALVGGTITLALIAMSLVSLIGRKVFSAPIPGDIEILEMAIAVAVAAFLPLCEIRDNNIRVDLLSGVLPDYVNRLLLTMCHLLLALVMGFICWRAGMFAIESYQHTETSTMLMVPLWIPQSLMLPSFGLLTLCALYRAGRAYAGEPAQSELDHLEGAVDE
ncbi:MAG: TRAP transporter small permease [Alcaligenaceae bacterium]|nr:TRAP transporter small permease [Alcaligenaceae bacterium]